MVDDADCSSQLDFDHLYIEYYEKMLHVSYRRTLSWETSEDAVQMVFGQLLGEPFLTWNTQRVEQFLFGTLKGYELRVKTKVEEPGGMYVDESFDQLPTLQDSGSLSYIPDKVVEFLTGLDEDDRELLEHKLAGLKDGQVAELLGIKGSSVEYRYRKLIIALKKVAGELPLYT